MSPTARPIRPLANLVVALVVAACAGKTPATTTPSSKPAVTPTHAPSITPVSPDGGTGSSSDAWLAVGRAGQDGLHVILASTGERILELPAGVPDSTWGRLVTASSDGATTLIRDLVVQPGFGGHSQTIGGAWRLPTLGDDPMPGGVSDDGRTIVLVTDGATPPRGVGAKSRFAIVRRSLDVKPRIVELAGSFEFDTLSPDGSILYVVEHLPGPPEGHYQVRAVEAATGKLRDAVVVDKTGSAEAMAGWPIAQVRRPDGMVFTLYRGAEHPFIHALNSIDTWALCIDLPANGARDAAAAGDWGLTATTNGRSLVAANATLGLAVDVPFNDLALRQSVRFDPSASTGVTLAKFGHQVGGPVGRRLVASPIGSVAYAAGPGGIVRITTDDLAVTGRFLEGVAVDAMAVTPDGAAIFALLHADGRIVRLDAASGAITGRVPGTGYDRLVAVVPW